MSNNCQGYNCHTPSGGCCNNTGYSVTHSLAQGMQYIKDHNLVLLEKAEKIILSTGCGVTNSNAVPLSEPWPEYPPTPTCYDITHPSCNAEKVPGAIINSSSDSVSLYIDNACDTESETCEGGFISFPATFYRGTNQIVRYSSVTQEFILTATRLFYGPNPNNARISVEACVETGFQSSSAVLIVTIVATSLVDCDVPVSVDVELDFEGLVESAGASDRTVTVTCSGEAGSSQATILSIPLDESASGPGQSYGSINYTSRGGSGTILIPNCCEPEISDIPFPDTQAGYEYSEPWYRGPGYNESSSGYEMDQKCMFGPNSWEDDLYGFPAANHLTCPHPLYVLADGTWICNPWYSSTGDYTVWNGPGEIEEAQFNCFRYHRCKVRPMGECHPCQDQGGGGGGGGGGGSNEIIPIEPVPVPPTPPIPGPMPGPVPPEPTPIYPIPPFPTEPGPGPIPGPGPNPGPYPEPAPDPYPIEPYPPGPPYPQLPPGPNIPPIPPDPIYPPSPDCCQEQTYIEYCKCMDKRTREFISCCGYMPKTFISWMDDYNERNR